MTLLPILMLHVELLCKFLIDATTAHSCVSFVTYLLCLFLLVSHSNISPHLNQAMGRPVTQVHTHHHRVPRTPICQCRKNRHANKQTFTAGWTVSQLNVRLADALSRRLTHLIFHLFAYDSQTGNMSESIMVLPNVASRWKAR